MPAKPLSGFSENWIRDSRRYRLQMWSGASGPCVQGLCSRMTSFSRWLPSMASKRHGICTLIGNDLRRWLASIHKKSPSGSPTGEGAVWEPVWEKDASPAQTEGFPGRDVPSWRYWSRTRFPFHDDSAIVGTAPIPSPLLSVKKACDACGNSSPRINRFHATVRKTGMVPRPLG